MPLDANGNDYHITLEIDDVVYGFNLSPSPGAYRKLDISDFAPKVASGALGYRDLSVWQVWAMEDWRHGFGQPYFIDESAYAKSDSGIDTRHDGIVTLATAITTSEEDESVSKFVDFNSKVYALQPSNGGVRVFTPGTGLWADAGTQTTGTCNDGINIGDYLIVALDGARVVKMNTSGTWSNAGKDANPPNDMGGFCLHSGYVWAFEDDNNWLHYAAEDDISDLEGSEDTDTGAIQVGAGDIPIVNMISYGGQLYVAREDGLWVIAEDNSPRMIMDFSQERHSSNFQSMAVWQGHLYFTVRHNIYRYTGSTILKVTPPRYDEVWPYHTFGDFKDLTPRGPFLFCRAKDSESTYHEVLLCYDGVGWHKLWEVVTSAYVINAMNLSPITDKLWLNYTGASVTTGYIPFQSLSDLPYDSYQTTGNHYLYTSKFDAGFRDVNKVCWKLRVWTNNCSSTETIDVHYQVDDSGTWVNIGTVNTSPYQELDFPDPDSFTTYGKAVQLRFNFETGSAGETPVLEAFAVLYLLRPEAVWGWQMPLSIASMQPTLDDSAEEELTAEDLMGVLEDARDQITPITFVDMWGTSHEVYLSAVQFGVVEWRPEKDSEHIELVARVSLTDAS